MSTPPQSMTAASATSGPKVAFLDLRSATFELRDRIHAAVLSTVDSGWYLLGDRLAEFERSFASYVGQTACVGVGNGLDALTLSLRALDIGVGDEVIVPSNTYVATWLAVSAVGATLVPVEPDPSTFNLDPQRCAEAMTPRTRAVLPVHLYGQPADLTALWEICRASGARLLEDAAQCHGARWEGKPIGGIDAGACWSFYPGKNLGALGDGGAVTSSDERVVDRLRVLRNYGSRVKYVNEEKGTNSRLDEVHAAVLSVKLEVLDEWNGRRAAIAASYLEAMASCSWLRLPVVDERSVPVWHVFVVRTADRERFRSHLGGRGVETLVHYPIPPFRQRAYENEFDPAHYPISDLLHSEVLSLPIGPHMSEVDVARVIDAVVSYEP